MIIVSDTREQRGKHKNIEQYFHDNGIKIIRDKLYVGDYTLPTDRTIAVDMKQDVVEISGNLCSKDHERFRAECVRAVETGTKLYILIEENVDSYGAPITQPEDLKYWKSPIYRYGRNKGKPYTYVNGETLGKIMRTMEKKYGVKFLFCAKEESGKIIKELLIDKNVKGS